MHPFFSHFLIGPGAFGLLCLRVVTGLAFMFHGWNKIQNPMGWMGPDSAVPAIMQACAAFAEFGGGLALILGLLTPLACLGLLCVMGTALFMVHFPKGDEFVGPPGKSFELPALYFTMALGLLFTGPGKYSLDYLLFKNRVSAKHELPAERPPLVPTA